MTSRRPDLAEVLRLASEFGVSKEAMALSTSRLSTNRLQSSFSSMAGSLVSIAIRLCRGSIGVSGQTLQPIRSLVATCSSLVNYQTSRSATPIWFDARIAARVEQLTEQCLGQANGFTMLLLHAEVAED